MITEHTICALPEDHRDYRHFAIKVQRRGSGMWVLNNEGFYYVGNHSNDQRWFPHVVEAVHLDEDSALALAEELAPTIAVNGITVAEALARAGR